MADADRLPEADLAVIAAQVGQRIAGIAGDLLTMPPSEINTFEVNGSDAGLVSETSAGAKATSVDMGESFAVWMLGADDVRWGALRGADLWDLARDTGHYHHQIRFDGKSLAYARSMPHYEGPGDRTLCELSVSALAENIQEAVDWSDDNVSDNYLARLLIIPAYHVRAFWFCDKETRESIVYVLSAPAQFSKLKLNSPLKSQDFFKALYSERAIIGYR